MTATKHGETMFKKLIKRLDGSTIERDLTIYQETLQKIREYESTISNKSDVDLKQLIKNLSSKNPNEILIEFYAITSVVIQRTLGLSPFNVQIIGAIAMHQGKLIEMQTGEGKTLTAVFTAALNALLKKGVHILTFNDYLAKRDGEWMKPVYEFLGLSVGYIQEGMSTTDRQTAYNADITYLTAKEAGFDFLRDGLCYTKENKVHRDFHLAIVDEADSILIDEARIPLVIAGSTDDQISETQNITQIIKQLNPSADIFIEEDERNFHLTENGTKHLESILDIDNIFDKKHFNLLTKINCAIHAEFLLKCNIDYIIKNKKIELVDEFTGRIADKRRWPDGLQAALEAKENLTNQNRGNILNSITLQHFIQLYPNYCGMTATAQDSEEELRHFYGLDITIIPPNRQCIREDLQDVIYKTKSEKEERIISHIQKMYKSGRPVLVGTASVKESEELSTKLNELGISNEMLNAKENEREAEIIAQAGKLKAITISTNMAGRGTDIKLGGSYESEKERVVALGGLLVLGTNKFESSRIDKQLRGRAGRQGDPGTSQYFISLEDDLSIKFGLRELYNSKILKNHTSGQIESKIIRKEIIRLQRIINGQNLEIKKTLNKYASTLEYQRQLIFNRRESYFQKGISSSFFRETSYEKHESLLLHINKNELDDLCKKILLNTVDKYWSLYLADVAEVREGIHLHRLGGEEPFFEFQKVVVDLFQNRLEELDSEAIVLFNSIKLSEGKAIIDENRLKAPTSTWTYLINDNPFENLLGVNVIGNIGLSLGAVMMTPLWIIQNFIKRRKK